MKTEFNEQQLKQIYPKGIDQHYWTKARLWHIEDALQHFEGKKLLEIGCGTGVSTRGLKKRGHDIIGCDLCVGEVTESEKTYLFYEQDFADLNSQILDQIEVVILLDVLEHIEHPKVFVSRIIEELPRLKEVLITLPARQELWSNFDEFNGHFCRYDLTTIQRLEQPRFQLLRAYYLFQLLYLPALFIIKIFGGRAETINPPQGLVRAIHGIAAWLIYLSSVLLSHFKFFPGTSVIASYRVSNNESTNHVSKADKL